ncbi:MAG: TIGR02680 family protein, partial [Acidimicrobiales bacterium]
MTTPMFADAPTAPPPLRPAERVGRWVLHRAGITNVWQYDKAELSFGGGRALLRGRNGAGKSKALEVLLPFLLDGDTRGIDAAGRDRTSVFWLMTDGRDPGNHVGYVWLELRMTGPDGDERFCTLGAGLKASTSTRQPTTWFFITDEARVGVDLQLDSDMSSERLRERLGSEAVTTAVEHRRRVAGHLFGLHDVARYQNLLHLLHRLRDPNIGNKIEAGELASVLRDALPPPSDEAMEKAGERFDTLDQVRDQLEKTQRTAAILTHFLQTYTGYARTVLRDRAQRVLDADSHRRRAERTAAVAATVAAEAVGARVAADTEVERLRDEESLAGRTLEGLQASEAYKQHQALHDRRRMVGARDEAARAAEGAATALESAAAQAALDHERAGQRWGAATERVRR